MNEAKQFQDQQILDKQAQKKPIEMFVAKVKELSDVNPDSTFFDILKSIKNADEAAFRELVAESSFAELLVIVTEILENEVQEKDKMAASQAASKSYKSENIGVRANYIKNPDQDDAKVAFGRLNQMKAIWSSAKASGISHIIIFKDFTVRMAEEARALRERVAEIKSSQDYNDYVNAKGSLSMDGSQNNVKALAEEIKTIQTKAKEYGFYPDFVPNPARGIYEAN